MYLLQKWNHGLVNLDLWIAYDFVAYHQVKQTYGLLNRYLTR